LARHRIGTVPTHALYRKQTKTQLIFIPAAGGWPETADGWPDTADGLAGNSRWLAGHSRRHRSGGGGIGAASVADVDEAAGGAGCSTHGGGRRHRSGGGGKGAAAAAVAGR